MPQQLLPNATFWLRELRHNYESEVLYVLTYTQRKKIMPNINESATEMSFEKDSCSVGESASNIDYGEVRLVASKPYQDEPLARPRPRRENEWRRKGARPRRVINR